MQAAADGGVPGPSGDRNDGHHSIVSELVSLIEHVQAGMKQLEAAIARESAPGDQDAAGNVSVLDEVQKRKSETLVATSDRNDERRAERL